MQSQNKFLISVQMFKTQRLHPEGEQNSLLVSLLCKEREESPLIRPVTMNGWESGE